MTFAKTYLAETEEVLREVDCEMIEIVAQHLAAVRSRHGRVFVLGVGGSAATASHFVNDLRKIAKIEAYSPVDNVAELTARTNDDGWPSTFMAWLDVSQLSDRDAVFIFSVGGGSPLVSENLVAAVDLACEIDAVVLGIVGRDGGFTLAHANGCILLPPLIEDRITPHTEGLASVIAHLLVSHPLLAL